MKKVIFCGLVLLATACNVAPTKTDVENNLKSAMNSYLNTQPGIDSAKVKFNIQTVTYFEDTTFYECEFKVKETRGNWDTIGVMTARVSKDFVTVKRKS